MTETGAETLSSVPLRVAVLTNVIPSYRKGFYDRLLARDDMTVHLFCQDRVPGMNLRTIHEQYAGNVTLLRFLSAKRDRLVWRWLPLRRIAGDFDVIFVLGNPRVLSDAIVATLFAFLRGNVVVWAMAHSARNRGVAETVRLCWLRLFRYLFLYNDAEVAFLRGRGFARQFMLGMNNGLDQKLIDATAASWSHQVLAKWRREQGAAGRSILLSCARLEPKNDFGLALEAFQAVAERVPSALWCIIGAGVEEGNLRAAVRSRGLDAQVRFLGELYDEAKLAPWFLSADLLVHPASIGLSLMHAFGYGLPVVTHGNAATHYPEFAAFEEGRTGRAFIEGDSQSLAATILDLLRDEHTRKKMRVECLRVARSQYNVDIMTERFVRMAFTAAKRTDETPLGAISG